MASFLVLFLLLVMVLSLEAGEVIFRAGPLPKGFPDADKVKILPTTTGSRPHKWYQTYHMTRYSRGCIDPHISVLKAGRYDTQIPWLHEFDLLVTGCSINWGDKHQPNREACVWQFGHDAELVNRVPESSAHVHLATNISSDNTSVGRPRPLRIHVSTHYPKAHDLFIETLLPFFEAALSRCGPSPPPSFPYRGAWP